MSTEVLLIISAVSFLLASFFAGAETALLATDRIRLRHLARKGDRRARLLLRYIGNPEYFLSIVLAGTNLGMIACTSTFTAVMIDVFGSSGTTVATLILVPTLVVFQEILPKGIFLYYADRAAILSVLPLRFFAIVLFPIIKSLSTISNLMMRMFGIAKVDRKITMSMEELLFHLRGSREAGLISGDTMTLASRAYELVDFTARDLMLPLDKVTMVEEGLSLDAYQAIFARERFSKLPVYRVDRQTIAGFLSIHNLLKAQRPNASELALEDPYVVSTDTPIVEMIVRMKNDGCHMAMVRDKTGTIVGMATLEDILERLVGAIADEFH